MKKLLLALLVLPIGMLAQDESKDLWQENMTSKVKLMKHSSRRADDRILGLFNQGVTNFNEDWSRDNCGVEVKCSSYTIQGGVIKNKVEWSSNPHFSLEILEP